MGREMGMTDCMIERDGNELCITLGKTLTAADVPEVRGRIKEEIDEGVREVVFDFSKTTSMDSTGIGLLIAANNSLNAVQGAVRLIHVSSDIMKLLQSMRLTTRLNATGD